MTPDTTHTFMYEKVPQRVKSVMTLWIDSTHQGQSCSVSYSVREPEVWVSTWPLPTLSFCMIVIGTLRLVSGWNRSA